VCKSLKSYVINLTRRPDRLKSVTERFHRVGLALTPFVAVDAEDLPPTSESDLVTRGIRACWRSHEKLLELIADGDDEVALILEDDVVPSLSVEWTLLAERIGPAMLMRQIDFLQLGFVSWQFGMTRPGALEKFRRTLYRESTSTVLLDVNRSVVLGSALSGTHAYAVSREFARRVSGINDPCWTGADGLYMRISSMSGTDGLFPTMARLKKSIAEQDSRDKRSSTLDSDVS
jgi:GR25 family glycosyltransferase involved in LPS biosynthesis